ncbi:MAG: cytochrome c5 family protein [Candidatus Omnitrophota bacterium]
MKPNKSWMICALLVIYIFFFSMVQSYSMSGITPQEDAPNTVAEKTDPEADLLLGEKVYQETCLRCHDTGLGGSPKITNTKAWKKRLDARGMDGLVEHALNGFEGDDGEMPPRGGNEILTDEEVRAAVLYLVTKSQEQTAP